MEILRGIWKPVSPAYHGNANLLTGESREACSRTEQKAKNQMPMPLQRDALVSNRFRVDSEPAITRAVCDSFSMSDKSATRSLKTTVRDRKIVSVESQAKLCND
jgi:hypothetical protein